MELWDVLQDEVSKADSKSTHGRASPDLFADAIANNWIVAYKKYFGSEYPVRSTLAALWILRFAATWSHKESPGVVS